MDALTALHTRVSAPRVREPGPDDHTLEQILQAGLRTADHGLLRPWRFLLIRGDGRARLGKLFEQAILSDTPDASAEDLTSAGKKALRAPLIVVGIASPKFNTKVPVAEQQLSTGGALQNMLTAAFALGVGAVWRTGPMATHPVVLQGLGLAEHESIIGFIYMGTVDGPLRVLRDEPVSHFVQDW